jgi:hypothetical protein
MYELIMHNMLVIYHFVFAAAFFWSCSLSQEQPEGLMFWRAQKVFNSKYFNIQ